MRRRRLSVAAIGLFAVLAVVYVIAQYPPELPQQPSPPTQQPTAGVVFIATLTTTQEVPVPAVTTPVIGAGVFFFDPATNTLSFMIVYRGLSGPVTNAHFHSGVPGVAGPVSQTICGAPAPPLLGVCPAGTSGVLAGTWTLPASLVPVLLSGGLYVNIHTAANPPGEIRGQINPL